MQTPYHSLLFTAIYAKEEGVRARLNVPPLTAGCGGIGGCAHSRADVRLTVCSHNTLRMQLEPVYHCSSLSTLDPGSGREITAICHGTVILPQNLSTGIRQAPGCSCILSVDHPTIHISDAEKPKK